MTLPRRSAERLYAVPIAGRLACPACGRLILYGPTAPHKHALDPVTCRLTCPYCNRHWQIATLVYSARSGQGIIVHADYKPTRAQLADIRTQLTGFKLPKPATRDQPLNLYEEDTCTCDPLPWRADCPVHGDFMLTPEEEAELPEPPEPDPDDEPTS